MCEEKTFCFSQCNSVTVLRCFSSCQQRMQRKLSRCIVAAVVVTVAEKKGRPAAAAAVVAVGAAAATPTHLTGSGFASGCHCCWPGFRLSFQLYAFCIRMHVCVCVCLLEGAGACHISGKKKNMLVYCQHACAPTRRMSNVAASATFRVPCQHAEQQ